MLLSIMYQHRYYSASMQKVLYDDYVAIEFYSTVGPIPRDGIIRCGPQFERFAKKFKHTLILYY